MLQHVLKKDVDIAPEIEAIARSENAMGGRGARAPPSAISRHVEIQVRH